MSAPKPTFGQAQPQVYCQCRWHPRISPKRRRGAGMAEGMFGGILGDEDEKPEVEAPEPLASAEAFAAAVAAKLAGNDPEVARDTSLFLKKQAQLLEIQA